MLPPGELPWPRPSLCVGPSMHPEQKTLLQSLRSHVLVALCTTSGGGQWESRSASVQSPVEAAGPHPKSCCSHAWGLSEATGISGPSTFSPLPEPLAPPEHARTKQAVCCPFPWVQWQQDSVPSLTAKG